MSELVNIAGHLMAANTYGKSVYCTLIGECVVNNVKITPEETVVMLQQVKGDMDRVFCCDEFGILYNKDQTILIRVPQGIPYSSFSFSYM